jgi:hypothetical protein
VGSLSFKNKHTNEQLGVHSRVAFNQTFHNQNCWVVLTLNTEQQLILKTENAIS